jgi:hypothetical protein
MKRRTCGQGLDLRVSLAFQESFESPTLVLDDKCRNARVMRIVGLVAGSASQIARPMSVWYVFVSKNIAEEVINLDWIIFRISDQAYWLMKMKMDPHIVRQ